MRVCTRCTLAGWTRDCDHHLMCAWCGQVQEWRWEFQLAHGVQRQGPGLLALAVAVAVAVAVVVAVVVVVGGGGGGSTFLCLLETPLSRRTDRASNTLFGSMHALLHTLYALMLTSSCISAGIIFGTLGSGWGAGEGPRVCCLRDVQAVPWAASGGLCYPTQRLQVCGRVQGGGLPASCT